MKIEIYSWGYGFLIGVGLMPFMKLLHEAKKKLLMRMLG